MVSADEKTSIQARARIHPTLPPRPGAPALVEHEYRRCGAWAYIAALDVHRAKVIGLCERKTGIEPFDRLVERVMIKHPYRDARRVFWVVDNGSSHRGDRAARRRQAKDKRIVLVQGPVHASWLNQIEIYFSIVERKALTPTTSPPSKTWRNGSTSSSGTTRASQSPSNGSSPAMTSTPCWTSTRRAVTCPSAWRHEYVTGLTNRST